MKRTETLTILSVFIIASLMMVIPTVDGAKITDDSWYRYSVVDESITIEYLIENNIEGAIDISIADSEQGCEAGILVHEDWDFVGSDPRTYEVERGKMYHVTVAAYTSHDKVNYTHEFCFDIANDVPVVELNEKNYVNAVYDKSNRELSIEWDFGTNPDRISCNLKTEYKTYNVLGYNSTSDFMGVNYNRTSHVNFLGYDSDNLGEGSILNTDSSKTLVDCKADDFKMIIPDVDMFSSYFTFTQFDMFDNKVNFELQAVVVDDFSVTPEVCGEIDPILDDFAFRQFVFGLDGDTDALFEPVEDCWKDVDDTPTVVEEPIITHTRKNIKVDMSDIIIALGTDFEYKVKVSTECDTDLESNKNIYKTKWIDTSIQSEMYVISSDFEKGKDYGVTYKIKAPVGDNTFSPIHCIESLGTVNPTDIPR